MSVEVGQEAPDFTLASGSGEKVTLSDYRGDKNVLLMFYPFAFSRLCTGELCTIRDRYTDFVDDDTIVLSVSCDPAHSLKAFAAQEGLTHPMLSDFWPHGAVSSAYGVFLEAAGCATRASFVIDKDGVVRWAVVNGPGETRNPDDYAEALAALS
ncbi:MAG: peroxiredoxin [Actinomycetes bacterium]